MTGLNKPSIFRSFRIDWPNHVIGFFSALFGILIAFELEEWRDRKHEQELALTALSNLKVEVQINQNILHQNILDNLRAIQSIQQFLRQVDDQLMFKGTRNEADSASRLLHNLVEIKIEDGSADRWPVIFSMGSISFPSFQTSAWESAKATGALTFLPYEKVISLSFVYNNAKIADELMQIRNLDRRSDNIRTRKEFVSLLVDLEKSHRILEHEMGEFDQFVNMVVTSE